MLEHTDTEFENEIQSYVDSKGYGCGSPSVDCAKCEGSCNRAASFRLWTGLQALMRAWAGPDQKYSPLLEDINRLLTNKQNNPRLGSPRLSARDVSEITRLEMAQMGSGTASTVIAVRVTLSGDRYVYFAVNLPQDLTVSEKLLSRSWHTALEDFAHDPTVTAQPISRRHKERAATPLSEKSKSPVDVNEWVNAEDFFLNHGHWFASGGVALESDAVWYCLVKTKALLSRITGTAVKTTELSLYSSDVLFDPMSVPFAGTIFSRL